MIPERDVKLVRTDTTLDLSQKAENGMVFRVMGRLDVGKFETFEARLRVCI